MLKTGKVEQVFFLPLNVNLWVAITLFCLLLQGCGPELTTEQYLQRARDAIEQGDPNTAVVDLKNALQSDPANGEARWLLGSVYVQLEDGVSAEKELRSAQKNGVAAGSIVVPLARALFLQSRYDDLIRETLPSNDLTPGRQAELLALRGQAYIFQGKLERAQEVLDKALNIDDQIITALVGHALVNMASGDLGAVRGWLERALAIDPNNHQAWGLLARLEEYSGNFDAAQEGYSKAIEGNIRPSKYIIQRALLSIQREQFESAESDLEMLPDAYFAKKYAQGLIQFRQENYTQAQNLFELALSKQDDYAPAMYFLGISHFMQGNELQADSYLREFLKRAPQSSSAAVAMANLQIRRGDLNEAESLLNTVLASDAENQQALELMAGALIAQGKQSSAINIYQSLATQNPDSFAVLTKLGLALMSSGEVSLGTASLEKAIALAPGEDRPQLALFLGLLNSGEKVKALASAEQWVANKPRNSSALLALGWALLANGQSEVAKQTFEEVLSVSPGNPSAAHNLAVLALQAGDLTAAINYYRASLEVYPGHAGTGISLAGLQLRIGQRKQAVQGLEKLWQNNPAHTELAVMLGRALLQEGDSDRAQQVLAESLKADAENTSLLLALGAAQAESANYIQAVGTLEHLVELQPNSARNYYLLAQANYKAGDKQGFTSALQKSYRLDPNVLDVQIAMLGLLLEQKQYVKAQGIVSKMLKNHPDKAEVYVQSARALMAEGKLSDSVKSYQHAHRLAPQRSDILVKFALAQWQLGDHDAAILTMETWLQKNPGNHAATRVATYNLASFYSLAGRKADALRAFSDVVANQPENVLALNNLASLLREADLPKALEYAERAYKLAPDAPAIADTLAMILLAGQGQEKRAVRLLEKAVQGAPGHPEISFNLARALLDSGEKQRSVEILKRLAKSNGDFPQKEQAAALLLELGVD